MNQIMETKVKTSIDQISPGEKNGGQFRVDIFLKEQKHLGWKTLFFGNKNSGWNFLKNRGGIHAFFNQVTHIQKKNDNG